MQGMAAPEPDRIVADRYALKAPLGRGGMGVVWHAHDTVLGRAVAIKEVVLPPTMADEERRAAHARVLREARAAARLNHPGAVTLYDVVQDQGHPFIVMELVPATTLADVVRTSGPLPPWRVAEIGGQLAATLEAAHRVGIVHRDVKPGNVMVAEDGGVKLADFGVASLQGDPQLTATGLVIGSPAYMAPEQAAGEPSGPPADFWALGATMFFAVEGVPPFDKGASIATLAAVVNEDPQPMRRAGPLAPVVGALLAKDPAARPPGPRVRAELQRLAAATSVTEELPAHPAAPPASTTAQLPAVPPAAVATPPAEAATPPAPPATPPTAPAASPPAAAAAPPEPAEAAGPPPPEPAAEPEPVAEDAAPPPEPAAAEPAVAEATAPPSPEPAAATTPPAAPAAAAAAPPEPAAAETAVPPEPAAATAPPSPEPAAAEPEPMEAGAPPSPESAAGEPEPVAEEPEPADATGAPAGEPVEAAGPAAGPAVEPAAEAAVEPTGPPVAARTAESAGPAAAGEPAPAEPVEPAAEGAGAAAAAAARGTGAPAAGPAGGAEPVAAAPGFGVRLPAAEERPVPPVSAPGRPGGGRLFGYLALAALVVLAGMLIAWAASTLGSEGGGGAAPSTSRGGATATTRAAGTPGAAGQLPAGWTSFTNRRGNDVVGVPPGWRARARESFNAAVVEEPDGARRVFTVRSANPANPLPQASRDYRVFAKENFEGFREIRFDEGATYAGRSGAVLFEYEAVQNGRRVHVSHINFQGRTGWGYNVEFATPVGQWDSSQALARQFEQAFRPLT